MNDVVVDRRDGGKKGRHRTRILGWGNNFEDILHLFSRNILRFNLEFFLAARDGFCFKSLAGARSRENRSFRAPLSDPQELQ